MRCMNCGGDDRSYDDDQINTAARECVHNVDIHVHCCRCFRGRQRSTVLEPGDHFIWVDQRDRGICVLDEVVPLVVGLDRNRYVYHTTSQRKKSQRTCEPRFVEVVEKWWVYAADEYRAAAEELTHLNPEEEANGLTLDELETDQAERFAKHFELNWPPLDIDRAIHELDERRVNF